MQNAILRGNYHTHTCLCRHADGMPIDYAREAVRQGLSILGISDHTPLPDDRWLDVRMAMKDLPAYLESIQLAREKFPQLILLTALECEYIPEYHHFYEDELLGRLQMDYLICAQHWFLHDGHWLGCFGQSNTPERLASYTNHLLQAMETGLFAFVAHPDIFGNDYPAWDASAKTSARAIAQSAADLNLPLEINGLGFRRDPVQTPDGPRTMYPWTPFWETAAEYNISVIINSDAHRPVDVTGNMTDACALAQRLHLPIIDLYERLTAPQPPSSPVPHPAQTGV